MNRKSALLASVLAAAAFGASAQEATLFEVPQGTLTRAEVKADLAKAQAQGLIVQGGEATVFAQAPVVGTRDRAEVRAEAAQLLDANGAYRTAYRNLYVGG